MKYRAEMVAEGMWVAVRGEDYAGASIHSTREEAAEKARAMNLEIAMGWRS